MSLFKHARFYTTVNHIRDLPPTHAEVAIVGRSNAGKSSALNTLCNHKRLAFVSKTPGRTQHINYFELGQERYLVDLPGYGYAKVPESVRAHWFTLLAKYLQTRASLIGLLLIMDIRHPMRPSDIKMLDFFSERQLPIRVILSKSDKLSRGEQQRTLADVKKALLPYPQASVQTFSSSKHLGMKEVDDVMSAWFAAHPLPAALNPADLAALDSLANADAPQTEPPIQS